MDEETVLLFQRILFGTGREPLPAPLVELYRKFKFRMDKIGAATMSPFQMVLLCELAGVLPAPERLRRVDGPVEGGDAASGVRGLDVPVKSEAGPFPEKKKRRRAGRPKGSKNRRPAPEPEPATVG